MDSNILLYQTPDGNIKIDVQLEDETVWINSQQMATLFNRDVKTIGKHINNIFAELQATNGRLMKKDDWIQKLDDFLKISEKELLKNAGSVNHRQAIEKANAEYEKYREAEDKKYMSDFDREMQEIITKNIHQQKK